MIVITTDEVYTAPEQTEEEDEPWTKDKEGWR